MLKGGTGMRTVRKAGTAGPKREGGQRAGRDSRQADGDGKNIIWW